ncbi:MAG: hypothetical protein ABFS09_06845 [Thermodesulfobacteriota bacterium]
MSKRLDIFLKSASTAIGWQSAEGYQTKDLSADSTAFAKAIPKLENCPALAGADVDVYLAEELLFFTQITLPRQTPDLKKAIALQLDMLSPFGGDSLYTFRSKRSKEGYSITLYFCRRSQIFPFLHILFEAGAHLIGLYPESQRYLNADNRKTSWSLWSPGRFGKITHFKQGKVVGRDICSGEVNAAQIRERTGDATLYRLGNVEGGEPSAMALLGQTASAREFDMLPPSFRRPDYIKKALIGLAAANLILILLLGTGKSIALYRQENLIDHQIESTKADAEAALKLKTRIKKLKNKLDDYRAMGTNKDLIAFMANISKKLPSTAYLDQLRIDQKTQTITIQGYTRDLHELTAQIPNLGSATLKSTLKRRNQTYFHLEVSMP